MSYSRILSKEEINELTNWSDNEEELELWDAANCDYEDDDLPTAPPLPPKTSPPPPPTFSPAMMEKGEEHDV